MRVTDLPRSWPRELACVAYCLLVAVVVTWPLVLVFGTRIAGDAGDPYQILWGMRWVRDAVMSGRNPFFTDRVFYPTGSTLVFQAFDLPDAIVLMPLWGWVPEVAVYNTAVLLELTITAYGMFRLVRELTGDAAAGLVAGTLFTLVPYQFAHIRGHVHLLAMGWLPLYLVHVVRIVHGRGTLRDGLYGGFFLAVTSLSSWYHLLYAAVLTPVLVAYGLVVTHRRLFTPRNLQAVLAGVVTWSVIVGPLLVAMAIVRASETIVGEHEAGSYGADLYSFVYPNAGQLWSEAFGNHAARWVGNATENATYVGVTMLVLAALGAWTSGLGRTFLVAACLGGVLALGPQLRVDGRPTEIVLPYAHLERALPVLRFTGVPIRFGYVMYLGLTVAAGFGLARLHARGARRGPRLAAAALVVPLGLVAAEYWPRPLLTTSYGVPPPMRAWADDPATFAVLDLWDFYRPMWHQTIHRKPMTGGYLTRVPQRLGDAFRSHPVIRPLLVEGAPYWFQRLDPGIDFDWGDGSPDAGILPDEFSVSWTGMVIMPTHGVFEFWLAADDDATVRIDDEYVVHRLGPCPLDGDCAVHASVKLGVGGHNIVVTYDEHRGPASVHLWWRPPGGEREIVPRSVFRNENDDPGLDGHYEQPVDIHTGLGTEGGREALRALGIRYVVTSLRPNPCLEQDLRLPLVYEGEDVRIYEVPARPAGS